MHCNISVSTNQGSECCPIQVGNISTNNMATRTNTRPPRMQVNINHTTSTHCSLRQQPHIMVTGLLLPTGRLPWQLPCFTRFSAPFAAEAIRAVSPVRFFQLQALLVLAQGRQLLLQLLPHISRFSLQAANRTNLEQPQAATAWLYVTCTTFPHVPWHWHSLYRQGPTPP